MASSKLHDEEAHALKEFQKCMFGCTQMAAIRCSIELGIADVIEDHPKGVTLANLSSALGCSPQLLHRIMRFLNHHGIFKRLKSDDQDSPITYVQTALSRLLMKTKMGPFFLFLTSPEGVSSRLSLSKYLVSKNSSTCPFEVANGADLWRYLAANPSFNEMFNKGMACVSNPTTSALIENCKATFEGIGRLVDVGGGHGTNLRAVVKACPWIIRAINFDRPHVVSSSSSDNDHDCVEHVGGDMFESVPSADATLIMSVLHDWDDEHCVEILKNCKQAIPRETGKVIIVDAVLDDEDSLNGGNNEYRDYHLASDIEMMCHPPGGKERTSKEWDDILKTAGFNKHTIKRIPAPHSVIEAYP